MLTKRSGVEIYAPGSCEGQDCSHRQQDQTKLTTNLHLSYSFVLGYSLDHAASLLPILPFPTDFVTQLDLICDHYCRNSCLTTSASFGLHKHPNHCDCPLDIPLDTLWWALIRNPFPFSKCFSRGTICGPTNTIFGPTNTSGKVYNPWFCLFEEGVSTHCSKKVSSMGQRWHEGSDFALWPSCYIRLSVNSCLQHRLLINLCKDVLSNSPLVPWFSLGLWDLEGKWEDEVYLWCWENCSIAMEQ